MVIPPHTLSQLKPKLLLGVDTLVQTQLGIPVVGKPVTINPSIEAFYRYHFQIAEGPLVSRNILCRLLTLHQNCLVSLKRHTSQYMLHVGKPLVYVHRRGDIKVLKHSDVYAAHICDHCESIVIKRIYIGELPILKFLLRYCKA